jgi:hypothetical protein
MVSAIANAGSRLLVPVSAHDTVLARAGQAIQRVEGTFASRQEWGGLKQFNALYAARRRSRGSGFRVTMSVADGSRPFSDRPRQPGLSQVFRD